jgi:NDP-sugar pyrophosphorylase family protein
MQALILAGGKGTRLRPLTVYTPKPIVPICNRPFLLYQIDTLRRAGVTDITLSLSYQPEKIEQQLADGSNFGVKLKYTVEPQPMGTAGAYKFAEDLIREPTVVFNGDVLTDLDLKTMIRQHKERQATATIFLMPVEDPSVYGVVETADDGRVLRFLEKPKPGDTTCRNINAGAYVLEPHVLDLIPKGEAHSFEYGLFPRLLEKGESFFAHIPHRTYWIDIGTPARYLQAHQDLLANRVSRIHIKERRGKFDSATHSEIDDLSMIADDCTIKPGAQIINSVLGRGCYIEERARIENSVIWSHTRVGTAAEVDGAVVGRGCHIGRSTVVGPGTVLGDKTSLTDYTKTCDAQR